MNKSIHDLSTEFTLGKIKTNAVGNNEEDIVIMSTTNFNKLLCMLPRTTNGQMIQDTIQNIKADLTELSFKSPHPTRKDIIDLLNTIIDEQSFWIDTEEMYELLTKDDEETSCEACDKSKVAK